ncbi:MAG: putative helix-destabilizing protein [Prokaryotic dsDNA virus sp.]|nr:MAG: putative helix-destabilizing protein [Prokaryotic dsDNA virus sp.]|tara:strand:- start:9178 stop:9741 length:564 start_codon:yes stop_codon:yes gene_type:complete
MPKLILQNVRCSYVYVDKQRKKDNGEDGGYGLQVIIPKDDPQVRKIQKAIDEALVSKHGEEAKKKKGRYKLPLRDGDEERDEPEYEGCYFFNVNGNRKPGIVNRNGEPADIDDLEEYCYSGAYFHVSCNFYGFPPRDGGKPGVAVGLNNVMLRKKGERLDGSVAATSEFADYAADDDSDDFDDDDDL